MTNNTIEKIDEITKKIDDNLSERLKRGRVEDLLDEIKVGLETLEKNAEESYKKAIDKKVKELQDIIKKNLDDEPGWSTTQGDLNKIKKGLVELQDEIEKLEKQENEIKNNYELEKSKRIEAEKERDKYKSELEKLQNTPSKSTGISKELVDVYDEKIIKLKDDIKGKEGEIKKFKQELEKLGKELEKAGAEPNLLSIVKQGSEIADNFVRLASETGDKIPLFGSYIGGAVALGTGAVHIGVIGAEIATNLAEKGATGAVGLVKKTEDDVKEVTVKSMDIGATAYENTRKGAENLTGKAMDNAKELVKDSIETVNVVGTAKNIAETLTKGIGHAEEVKAQESTKARIAEAESKARIAEAEAKAKVKMAELELARMQINPKQ